jgi:hypothetical protein
VMLVGILLVGLIASLSRSGAEQRPTGSPAIPKGAYTNIKMTLNGVKVSDVNVPGVPTRVPFAVPALGKINPPAPQLPGVPGGVPVPLKPGGKVSVPRLAGKGAPPSNHDYWFQWWYGTYNASHSLMYEFSQWYYWTGNGQTISFFETDCEDDGGYWTFKGCSTKQSSTGHSKVHAYGRWVYGCCQNNYWEYEKYPHADVDAFSDGTITGTVYSG